MEDLRISVKQPRGLTGTYYSGLSDGNKGEMRIGAVLTGANRQIVEEIGFGFPGGINGTSEWLGMFALLSIAQGANLEKVYAANQNVIYAMQMRWKVKALHTLSIAQECWKLGAAIQARQGFPIEFKVIPSNFAARSAYRHWKASNEEDSKWDDLRAQMWAMAERASMIQRKAGNGQSGRKVQGMA